MVVIGCVLVTHVFFINPTIASNFDKLATVGAYFAVVAAITSNLFAARQADAAQKQLRHALGDGFPTLDILGHLERPDELIVQVINWNRRTILVHDVQVREPEIRSIFWIADRQGEQHFGNTGKFSPPIRVDGFEKRDDKPPRLRIYLIGMQTNKQELIDRWDFDVTIAVSLEIVDEKHTRLTLIASLPGVES
jgi:hypothetical protein